MWKAWILPSWQLARNSLTGRRKRTILLVTAIGLAATLLTAVSCAIASAQASLEDGVKQLLGAADARITHPASARFSRDVLEEVRGWPEVTASAGRITGTLRLAADPNAPDDLVNATAIGVRFADEARFRSFTLTEGTLPEQPDDILIDEPGARSLNLGAGDRILLRGAQGLRAARVSGVYQRQRTGMRMSSAQIHLDLDVLAELAGLGSDLLVIYIVLDERLDAETFCADAAHRVPTPLVLEPADRVRAGFDRRVRGSRIGLTVATAIVFLCCGFIVVTGMTTGVSERQRELAMLRAVGASRAHLVLAQILLGTGFGVTGALIGIPTGIALTAVLVEWYREFVPSGIVINQLGLVLAALGAVGSGFIGALWPAVTAARVAPLEALRPYAKPVAPRTITRTTIIGIILVLMPLLSRLPDDVDHRFWVWTLLGLPALFIGCFLLAVPLLLVVNRSLGPILARCLRLPADLLTGSLNATPFRSGFTAGALMIGTALLVNTWSSGMSMQADWLERIRFADGFVFRAAGISPEQAERVVALPFVLGSTSISRVPVRIVGQQVFGLTGLSPQDTVCIGVDTDEFFGMNAVEFIEGEREEALARLRAGTGVLVADRFTTARSIRAGDRITLGLGTIEADLEVVGVVSSAGLDFVTQLFGLGSRSMDFAISCVFLDSRAVETMFDLRDRQLMLLDLDDSVPDERVERAILDAVPGALFQSGRAITGRIRDLAGVAMKIRSIIALGAMLLASLAVASVVAAGIQTRRFELGVLRSVGAESALLLRLVLAETALLALTGALVGTLLGTALSWMDVNQMRDLAGVDMRLAIPILPTLIGWGIVLVITLAAVLPAGLALRRRTITSLIAGGRGG